MSSIDDPVTDASPWPYRFFTRGEMRCKGTGILQLHPGFMESLEELRAELGEPMKINSACRASSHNAKVGGHPRSLHVADKPHHAGQLGCLAVDVSFSNGAYRGRLIHLAWKHGFSVGWNKSFVHLDRRDLVGLPQNTFDY